MKLFKQMNKIETFKELRDFLNTLPNEQLDSNITCKIGSERIVSTISNDFSLEIVEGICYDFLSFIVK